MKDLLHQYRLILDHFFAHLELDKLETLFHTLLQTKGTVIFTGVGKSGLICQKIASTFVSTGTKATCLSPSSALHGDIGMAKEGDLLVAISKSGESQELLDLVPFAHKKRVATMAVVSRQNSRLENLCDQTLLLPLLRELCPFDLAPTTSTALQLIFGDVLAIALMRAKGFSVTDFANNHPAGLLGKKIVLKVADVMLKADSIPRSTPTDRLIDQLHELSGKKCGCLLIVNEQEKLEGIFTDGDLRRAIQKHGASAMEKTLATLMTRSPKTVEKESWVLDAMRIMEAEPSRPITVLPVLEEGRVVGLIRMHDILQAGLH
jgi:arabinose-5-phosphate isomerase